MKRTRKGHQGFTLTEVLVAVGLTSVFAVGLYSISRVAAQTFQQQQRVSELQLRLRNGMEMLRADIQRAGYMSTPSSVADTGVCPKPVLPLQAIRLEAESPNPTYEPSHNTGINPARMFLTGNFITTDEYLVMAIDGTRVLLQNKTLAYTRIAGEDDFRRVFLNRVVRLRGTNGQMQFNQVVDVQWSAPGAPVYPVLNLATAPAIVGQGTNGCGIPGLGVGATIAPIAVVSYGIANVAGSQPRAYEGSAAFMTGKTDLVRREWVPTAGGLVAVRGGERIVAEYAVDLAFGAVLDEGAVAGVGAPTDPVLRRYNVGDVNLFTQLGPASVNTSRAQRIRSLLVRLSLRDRGQDHEFGWAPRNTGDPLTRFRVFPNEPGAARVRSATTEVELPNVALPGLR